MRQAWHTLRSVADGEQIQSHRAEGTLREVCPPGAYQQIKLSDSRCIERPAPAAAVALKLFLKADPARFHPDLSQASKISLADCASAVGTSMGNEISAPPREKCGEMEKSTGCKPAPRKSERTKSASIAVRVVRTIVNAGAFISRS